MSGEQIPVSQFFQKDPRGWTSVMVEKLMQPGVHLRPRTRSYLVRMRERLATDEGLRLGPNTYERLCRVARAAGVLAKRRRIPRLDERPVAVPAQPVPERFQVGARIPSPPPLRRPFVMLGEAVTETWDPAGMPGL
jgi:hypothetical protein